MTLLLFVLGLDWPSSDSFVRLNFSTSKLRIAFPPYHQKSLVWNKVGWRNPTSGNHSKIHMKIPPHIAPAAQRYQHWVWVLRALHWHLSPSFISYLLQSRRSHARGHPTALTHALATPVTHLHPWILEISKQTQMWPVSAICSFLEQQGNLSILRTLVGIPGMESSSTPNRGPWRWLPRVTAPSLLLALGNVSRSVKESLEVEEKSGWEQL